MRICIIIPTLNESSTVTALLDDLQPARQGGAQVIVADGGSADDTVALAGPLVDEIVRAPRGRARQMNQGALRARGDVLWFLHADTRVPRDAYHRVLHSATQGWNWGRFDIRLSGTHPLFHVIARCMNLRSCLTGIATGDQGLFVMRDRFEDAGRFPDLPLMEDIALSKRLRRVSRPACVRDRLTTSSRRWERQGIVRTVLLMWRLRLAYALGADPERLAKAYEA